MPGFLVHVGAVVTCAHAGQAQAMVPEPAVLVSDQPIVTLASPYEVAGCTFPPPPTANGPCVTATFLTASLNVTSFGQPVLLTDSTSLCAPTDTPLIVGETQLFVSAL